jgi:hypothetical protein
MTALLVCETAIAEHADLSVHPMTALSIVAADSAARKGAKVTV